MVARVVVVVVAVLALPAVDYTRFLGSGFEPQPAPHIGRGRRRPEDWRKAGGWRRNGFFGATYTRFWGKRLLGKESP